MKKGILCFMLLAFGVLSAQQTLDLESLLERLDSLPDSSMPFQYFLKQHFTNEESQLLMDHFSKKMDNSNEKPEMLGNDIFYAANVWNFNHAFGILSALDTQDFEILNTDGFNLFLGDDFDGNGDLYALLWPDDMLAKVNTEDGSYEVIGPLTGGLPTSHLPSGLAWDPTTGTMYAMSTTGDSSDAKLYSISLVNGHLTPIGDTTTFGGGEWLAITEEGKAFTVDVNTDAFYSVNLETGETTWIADLGIDISFAQDASYDFESGRLFMAAFMDGGVSQIYTIDTITGELELFGDAPAFHEFGGFSTPYVEVVLDTQEFDLESVVAIYPNPASDFVSVNASQDIEVTSVEVYDISGRSTGKEIISDQINLADLTNGVYFINIETSQGRVVKRVIKN